MTGSDRPKRVAGRADCRSTRKRAHVRSPMAAVAAEPTSDATMPIGSSVSSQVRTANTSGRSTNNRLYRPENTALIVVGDFDPDLVEAEIREHFASWQPQPVVPGVDAGPIPFDLAGQTDIYVDPALSEQITVSRHGPTLDRTDTRAFREKNVRRQLGYGDRQPPLPAPRPRRRPAVPRSGDRHERSVRHRPHHQPRDRYRQRRMGTRPRRGAEQSTAGRSSSASPKPKSPSRSPTCAPRWRTTRPAPKPATTPTSSSALSPCCRTARSRPRRKARCSASSITCPKSPRPACSKRSRRNSSRSTTH